MASAEMAIGKRDECGINENVKQCQFYSDCFQSVTFILTLKSFKVTFNFTLLDIFSLLIHRPDFLMGEGVPKQTKIIRGEPRGREKKRFTVSPC